MRARMPSHSESRPRRRERFMVSRSGRRSVLGLAALGVIVTARVLSVGGDTTRCFLSLLCIKLVAHPC